VALHTGAFRMASPSSSFVQNSPADRIQSFKICVFMERFFPEQGKHGHEKQTPVSARVIHCAAH